MTNTNPIEVAAALSRHVDALASAKAEAARLRKIVDQVCTDLLAESVYLDDEGQRVTDPRYDWTIEDDQQAAAYFAAVLVRTEAAGLDMPGDDKCPALVAESAARDAEAALIEAATPFFGVTVQQMNRAKSSDRAKYISLLIAATNAARCL